MARSGCGRPDKKTTEWTQRAVQYTVRSFDVAAGSFTRDAASARARKYGSFSIQF